ncbi:MAG: alpha/beta fold hydrolase [Desulfovibrio sp.]|jgi:dienelactone hydrolase
MPFPRSSLSLMHLTRAALLLCLATLFCACANGRQQAAHLAETARFQPQRYDTKPFVLQGWLKPGRPGGTLFVYIEGDGMAWRRANRPSSDPTPTDPIGLRLAIADPATQAEGAILYLARPCQYTEGGDRRGCTVRDWTSARFSERAVAALDEAVNQAKARTGARSVALHGFSGGGGMAALLAERRTDVVFLATVAGNLDHALWTSLHGDTPLELSLNPVDRAGATRNIPQLHVIGGRDAVVPKAILDSWCTRLPGAAITRVTEPEATHSGPWEAVWPGLLRQARKL